MKGKKINVLHQTKKFHPAKENLAKWRGIQQKGRKYLRAIHLIRHSYPKYIRRSSNATLDNHRSKEVGSSMKRIKWSTQKVISPFPTCILLIVFLIYCPWLKCSEIYCILMVRTSILSGFESYWKCFKIFHTQYDTGCEFVIFSLDCWAKFLLYPICLRFLYDETL